MLFYLTVLRVVRQRRSSIHVDSSLLNKITGPSTSILIFLLLNYIFEYKIKYKFRESLRRNSILYRCFWATVLLELRIIPANLI